MATGSVGICAKRRSPDAGRGPSGRSQAGHAPNVQRKTNRGPFSLHLLQAAHMEPTEPENFLDPSVWRFRQPLPLGVGSPVLRRRQVFPFRCVAGRLTPQKDFATLIEAFHRVSAERSCRLVILGEGPRRPQLEDQVRALGIEDCVSRPGWTENPHAFMSKAALFVLSSRYEGFPGVLVEALACGCPAAATDCPAGPSEILEDLGLLAPVGDLEVLWWIMLRVLDRPVDKAALRALAVRFFMRRAVDRYENVIARIIARQSGNRLG